MKELPNNSYQNHFQGAIPAFHFKLLAQKAFFLGHKRSFLRSLFYAQKKIAFVAARLSISVRARGYVLKVKI